RGIWGANGQFVGLGIVTVDLRRVAEQLLADDRFGNTHLSAVLDDGRILITLQGAAIQFRAEDSWYAPDRLLNARTQQALGGSSLTDLAVAAQGTGAMIIRDALSRDFPISVFAQVPIEVVLGDWRTRAERFALVLGVLLLVLGGMGFLYMRQERARRSAVQSLIAEEQRLSFALDATGVGLWDWSIGTGQVYFSQENASMLKEPSGARLDRFEDWVARLHPEDQEAFRQQIGAALQQPDQPLLVDFRLRRTDGPWIWVRCRGKVVEQDRHGQPIRMIGTNTDVTASKSREIDLEYQGLHDALTGLGNRRAFDRLVAGVGARVERQRTLAAGVMFDLDHFKKVNDTYGHDVGDLVLQEVAKRVQEALSADERDQVFRVGGEEFALVLPDLREQGAAERAECIRTVIGSRPFALPNGVTLTVTVSLGVSVLQDGAGRRDWMALFKTADQALYHSKQNGRNRVTVVPQPRLEDASQHSGQGNTDPSLWTAAE
ncbi:MAG: GGDEF domain-containing protein, partial [Rhodospirillaceae bacterium]